MVSAGMSKLQMVTGVTVIVEHTKHTRNKAHDEAGLHRKLCRKIGDLGEGLTNRQGAGEGEQQCSSQHEDECVSHLLFSGTTTLETEVLGKWVGVRTALRVS